MTRKPYPSDVSDEERAFVAPSLTFMTEDAPQCDHALRLPCPPLPPRRGGRGAGGGKGGAQRTPAMTGINVPPSPSPQGGERGGGKVHVAEAVHYRYARKYITGSSGDFLRGQQCSG